MARRSNQETRQEINMGVHVTVGNSLVDVREDS